MNETTDQGPEELRRDIARTRADMDTTLAELEDKVSPSRIRERQTEKVRSRWRRTREAVMGSSSGSGPGMRDRMSGAAEGTSGTMEQAGETMREAPQRIEEMTRGNPIAVGMIAFGIGALAGSLLPSSRPEQSMASELRQEFEEPVRSELQQAGQEVKSELQDHAKQAMEETKQTAKQGAERTKEQAQDSAEQVREHAQSSSSTVPEQP